MKALERLRQGEPVFGLFQTFPEAAITELALYCGFDFVVIDCEHGVVNESAQLEVLRTVSGSNGFALVRTRLQDDSAVARYLDFGADGVIVPDVRTVEQARRIGFAATGRWTGGLRGDRYGLDGRDQCSRPLVIVLIEAEQGVVNVEGILDVPGIDGVVVGSGDLSTQLGSPGDFTSARYIAAVERVESAARARQKIIGSKPDKHLSISDAARRGHRLILLGRDMGFIRQALTHALAGARSQITGAPLT